MNASASHDAPGRVERIQHVARTTMGWFPVRVWRRVLAHNGLLLSAGLSYQALFATFAALYVGLALFGVWFVNDATRLTSLVDVLNTAIPGLVGPEGAINQDQLVKLAQHNFAEVGLAGAIAVGVLIWTATGWITYARMAIRTVFGLGKDPGSYLLLKSRDLLTALVFGGALLAGTVLTTASTKLLQHVLDWLGIGELSTFALLSTQAAALLLVFVLDTLVLATMFVTLSGALLKYHQVWVGAVLGGLALSVLQLLSSLVLGTGTSNPLLGTFVTFVTLLLWFRLTAIVMLTAAAWVAESALDRGEAVRAKKRKPSKWTPPPLQSAR